MIQVISSMSTAIYNQNLKFLKKVVLHIRLQDIPYIPTNQVSLRLTLGKVLSKSPPFCVPRCFLQSTCFYFTFTPCNFFLCIIFNIIFLCQSEHILIKYTVCYRELKTLTFNQLLIEDTNIGQSSGLGKSFSWQVIVPLHYFLNPMKIYRNFQFNCEFNQCCYPVRLLLTLLIKI